MIRRAFITVLASMIWCICAIAQTPTTVGITYDFTDDTHTAYKVSGYTSDLPFEVVIPSTHEGLPVTEIGDNAFYYCSRLFSIEIPSSVTTIGNSAFSGCSDLTSIEIPNSVTSIGDNAFSACSYLFSIEIPNSVTTIGKEAFSNCIHLKSIEIPESVAEISEGLFLGCYSFKYIGIPSSVTAIGVSAFQDCSGLVSIEIPESVTLIGDYAFYGCLNSDKFSITIYNTDPSSITLGEGVFVNQDWFGEEYSYLEMCTLFVPTNCVDTYQQSPVWGEAGTIQEILYLSYEYTNDYETSYKIVGYTSTLPSTLIIPDNYRGKSVTAIGEGALSNCSTVSTR